MGEAKEENEIGDQSSGYPRDLLQRLNHQERNVRETNHHTEEIELNLGLSLGGRFGVEPKGSKLVRSSSIAGLSTFLAEDDGAAPPLVGFPLVRTSSLPMESEEEMRRRKEIQSLRRLQAKRKRSEKKSIRLGKEKASVETNCRDKGVDGDGLIPNKAKVEGRLTGFRSKAVAVSPTPKIVQAPKNGVLLTTAVAPQTTAVAPPFGTPNWPRSSLQVSPKRKANAVAGQGFLRPSKQGSVASHGNSSSGDSKSETRSVQGLSNSNEVRSATSIPSSAEPNEQKPVIAPELSEPRTSASVKVEVESPSKKPRVTDNLTREPSTKVMNDMPCVSTKGDGPNGRRIQGFLYNYKKGGEDVRIVCVCHGEFLTPAEFVKHGGGGDVAHPLKHIVVTPPTPLL